ncbi:response regulator transcription factor [uncultured Thiodictyon sp.]|uniref:response regulator transcription factor n=1 Tax=uncultured Thiodictyon sp. TaxID=1846217 RepID=UPI0025E1D513|nr:response regulator transcription factor [uncultured Thiodictyon sp.]
MPISVILAEDHAIVRQGLAALLQAEPDIALLGQAADGAVAWGLILTHQPAIAILDLSMPQATGIEVVRRVEAAALDTRCLLLTMHDDPAAAQEAQEAGAAGYVLKDNSFEELVMAVRGIAAGGTFVTPSIRARLRALQRNGHKPAALSDREREVLRLVALGHSSKAIARTLAISPRTVDTYRNRLMHKLGLHSVADVVRYAVQAGMFLGHEVPGS